MRWIITEDVNEKENARYGIRSRRGCGNYSLSPDDLPLKFRTLDDDGNIDYYGRADVEGFAPLRFAKDDVGDTEIQFAGTDEIYKSL